MKTGLQYFLHQLNNALHTDGQSHLGIYGTRQQRANEPRRDRSSSTLTEKTFSAAKLRKLRESLENKAIHLSHQEKVEIVFDFLQENVNPAFSKEFSKVARDYWTFLFDQKLAKFQQESPEIQRLQLLQKITPPDANAAHKRHLARVVDEKGAGGYANRFKEALKRDFRGQVYSDFYVFFEIAADVFLKCIPRWEILDCLAETGKKSDFPLYKQIAISAHNAGVNNPKIAGILDRYFQENPQERRSEKLFKGRSAKSLSNTLSSWKMEGERRGIRIPANLHITWPKKTWN